MLPYAHMLFGSAFSYLKKRPERTLFMFLVLGFLGVMPDFDFFLRTFGIEGFHRTWTHGIVGWVVGGIITLYLFKTFWPGFLAVTSHFILDLLDSGSVSWFANWRISLPQIYYEKIYGIFGIDYITHNIIDFKNAQLWISTILGTTMLVIFIIIEWRKGKWESTKQKAQ